MTEIEVHADDVVEIHAKRKMLQEPRETKRASRATSEAASAPERLGLEPDREARKAQVEAEREAKRLKLEAEKEARRVRFEEEKQLRAEKKEEERLRKVTEKEQKDQERQERKRAVEAEKEAKRKVAELEREARRKRLEEERKDKKQRLEIERQKKEADREAKRAALETEKRRREEERKHKLEGEARKQSLISSFFTVTKPKVVEPVVAESEYHKTFLPFYLKENCYWPSQHQLSELELARSRALLDGKTDIAPASPHAPPSGSDPLADFFRVAKEAHYASTVMGVPPTPVEITQAMNQGRLTAEITLMLTRLPIKVLCFYENARPPFIGTFTKTLPETYRQTPFFIHPDLDYDYDSDIEWERENEDGEGEDLGDEDELSDAEPATDSDMDDFVDENDAEGKIPKRKILGPLIPVVEMTQLEAYTFQAFVTSGPLDPFKDYWKKAQEEEEPAVEAGAGPAKKSKPTVSAKSDLRALCAFVEANNDFTIGTLVELAKKQFAGYSKAVLRNTIDSVATKVKEGERKWSIDPEYLASIAEPALLPTQGDTGNE